ncbi:unnamed protein product [Paramecium sonneborni]|uniref:Uncharacterized protein n=1 Tax=Paramecium sonneborni TaxID=65129 RepID=A0A8S1NF33_9CILI|nr:unnamed protein product [Paramecium sonneborni]
MMRLRLFNLQMYNLNFNMVISSSKIRTIQFLKLIIQFYIIVKQILINRVVILVIKNVMVHLTQIVCLVMKIHKGFIYLNIKIVFVLLIQFDKVEKCFTDKNQKFSIIEQNNDDINKNCKQGFYELDGEFYKCPSIINENSISCYECYKNPQEWSSNPNCDMDLYLKASGTVEDTMIRTDSFLYKFDGIDLNFFYYYCQQIKEIQNEEGNYNLYQYLYFGFINFCQIEEIRMNSKQCYVCKIDFCQDCYIT